MGSIHPLNGQCYDARRKTEMRGVGVPGAERWEAEVRRLQQEIVMVDTIIKRNIDSMPTSVDNERALLEETRRIKDLIKELNAKIEQLAAVGRKIPIKVESSEVANNVFVHSKECDENKNALRTAAQRSRARIAELARKQLLEGSQIEIEIRRRIHDERIMKQSANKASERLSDLVTKMGDRVKQSELAMDNLVHSSSVLSKTHSEFESQAGHIQTGGKLLSKFERRELTDKILVCIALSFYFAVIYYILQKRVFMKFWLW